MPKKLDVDWEQAKLLYVNGLTLRQISDRLSIPYNAIRTRSSRYKWHESVTQTQQTVQQVVREACADSAKNHVNTVIGLLGRHLKSLEGRDPDTLGLQDFEIATKILDRLDQIGRRTHGLDAESKTIHVGLVQNVVEIKLPDGANGAKPAQVVDIQADKTESSER